MQLYQVIESGTYWVACQVEAESAEEAERLVQEGSERVDYEFDDNRSAESWEVTEIEK